MLLVQERRAYGDQHNADGTDQLIQRAHHLALGDLVSVRLCRRCQPIGVAVGTHAGQTRHTAPRHQITAGAQRIPRRLGDGVGFTGQQRFICLRGAGKHHRVRHDLIPSAKLHHVILDQFLRKLLAPRAVAQAAHPPGRNQRQLVHGLFGAQLLKNADDGIAEHNAQKAHIQPRADQRQHDRQHQKNQIEVGADIVPHDLPHRLGGGLRGAVALPCLTAAFDLLRGKTLL